jgi:hypothetical protein
MFKIGDRVRLSEATRKDFLEHGMRGEHVEVARENRTGTVVQRVGTPGRHLVIGYLIDFGDTYFVVSEEGLVLAYEKVEEEDPET